MRKKLCLMLTLALMFFTSALVIEPAEAAEVSAKKLHRLDCRLEKASCATCILKVRTALRATPGVVACEIALRKPYGAVIIFEPTKINLDKLKSVAQNADPHKRVELVDEIDRAIDKVPPLLLPIYTTLKAGP